MAAKVGLQVQKPNLHHPCHAIVITGNKSIGTTGHHREPLAKSKLPDLFLEF
ncbi:hypothetical protein HanPSC8_Chr15g0682181 [Helianthus annuus]|nr:hypothetical protein HanPSC8_Chr15g0682181 [Helianthus annuus]